VKFPANPMCQLNRIGPGVCAAMVHDRRLILKHLIQYKSRTPHFRRKIIIRLLLLKFSSIEFSQGLDVALENRPRSFPTEGLCQYIIWLVVFTYPIKLPTG